MKLGSIYVERGDDCELRLRLPTLQLWRAPRCRTVIWGGNPDRDVWIGSPEDLDRERWRKIAARRRLAVGRMMTAATQITLAFRDSMGQAVGHVNAQMRALDRTIQDDRSLGRARQP